MPSKPPGFNPDSVLRIAAEPSRDALRLALARYLDDDLLHAKTMLGLEGGPFTEHVCRAIRDTGVMPSSEVMSGQVAEAGHAWPRELLELTRWGSDCAAWQCFACWVLLTWVADPADDNVSDPGDETICSLVSAAILLDEDVRAKAISFLIWPAGARNEPGPTVYHELGIACILASLFRSHPGGRLRDALDAQCCRVLETADRELLEAI
ncbi:MAG: hypothetical protein ACF8LL_11630, partial [Phycisphaerales bacterium]